MVKNGQGFRDHGTLSIIMSFQVYLTNDLMNWANWLNDFCILIMMEWFLVWPPVYSVSLTFILYWSFPCGWQSSQIIYENFILKFLKNIKPRSLQKGSYKISSVHLSVCLSTYFSQDLLSGCSSFFAWGYFAIKWKTIRINLFCWDYNIITKQTKQINWI